MVKVPKPTPKTLKKSENNETTVTKKMSNIKEKQKQLKDSAGVSKKKNVIAVALGSSSKKNVSKKAAVTKVNKEAIKASTAKLMEPLKKCKKDEIKSDSKIPKDKKQTKNNTIGKEKSVPKHSKDIKVETKGDLGQKAKVNKSPEQQRERVQRQRQQQPEKSQTQLNQRQETQPQPQQRQKPQPQPEGAQKAQQQKAPKKPKQPPVAGTRVTAAPGSTLKAQIIQNERQKRRPMSNLKRHKINRVLHKKRQLKLKEKHKREAAEKKPVEYLYEALPFDEDKFNDIVNLANVSKIAKALKDVVEKEVEKKKTAIFDDYRYVLDVASFKIPNVAKRMVKLSLEHSLVTKDDDILCIVADLQRGSKVDYEPTIQHYTELFREAGIEGLTIMPFNQLRNEYKTFETVRKLSNTYDYFLCDGRIVGHAVGFCGKVFQKSRTTFHAVHLDNPSKIKTEIEKGLRRTAYKRMSKGDLISIPVGSHTFKPQQLAENVLSVVAHLKESYPGGLANVRSMHLKISLVGTSSVPLYISTAQPPADTPYVVGPREARMLKMRKDANAVLSKFYLSKEADIVKLTGQQVKNKRKLKEALASIQTANDIEVNNDNEEDVEKDNKIPAKKAKLSNRDKNKAELEPTDAGIITAVVSSKKKLKNKTNNGGGDSQNPQKPQPQDGDTGVPAKRARRDDEAQKKTLDKKSASDDDDSRLEGNDCDDIDDVEDDDSDDDDNNASEDEHDDGSSFTGLEDSDSSLSSEVDADDNGDEVVDDEDDNGDDDDDDDDADGNDDDDDDDGSDSN